MNGPGTDPKVTVLIMTYNHVRYIDQCIDSALDQEADFDYEIIVSEDCSTDGTQARVIDYQARFPERIRLLLSPQNLHSNAVVARGLKAARGEYIALLDGDDYWVSREKLRKQVAFLDAHPGCAICFHNAMVVVDDGSVSGNWTPAGQKRFTTFDDILLGNYIATCSTMFRRGLFGAIPDWYDDFFPITDWPLHILNAEHGDIGYIDEVLGAYRLHVEGMYSPLSESDKLDRTLDFYRRMNRNLDFRHNRAFKTALSRYFFEWAEEYLRRGDKRNARRSFHRCLLGRPVSPLIPLRHLAKTALRVYSPRRATPGAGVPHG